jgi:hypothetical protein
MINRLQFYESEALMCDAIVIATVLNPRLRMKFFELHHPSQVTRVQRIVEQNLDSYVVRYQATHPITTVNTVQQDNTVTDDKYNVFASMASGPNDDTKQEMEGYLSGKFPLSSGTLLSWWKVRFLPLSAYVW